MNNALKNLIRSHYLNLPGYVSAGMESDKTAEKVYLNANENPYAIPGLEGLNRYPEPQPKALLEGYARAYGCMADQVLATRGADEAIALLTRVFCEPHKDAVVIHSPTFGMYAVNGQALPVEIKDVPLIEKDGTFHLDKGGMIALATSPPSQLRDRPDQGRANPSHPSPRRGEGQGGGDVKLIYLCNPNNPTGTVFPAAEILEIAEAVRGKSLVVLDEAYIEFSSQESLVPALADHPNLVILRTMSKAYALAGARMGCMISGDPDFITFMKEKVSDIYPIPKPCIAAALTAFEYDMAPIIDNILAERDRMIEELSPLVDHIYPSDTNFLLVKMEKAAELYAHAKERDVLLRDFSNKIENCLRLTIGTPEENNLVLELLKSFHHEVTKKI